MDINENSTVLEQAMPVQVTEAEAEQEIEQYDMR
jgi:hypothetical protein